MMERSRAPAVLVVNSKSIYRAGGRHRISEGDQFLQVGPQALYLPP